MNNLVRVLVFILIPFLLGAESISEKKASLLDKSDAREADAVFLNQELSELKKRLQESYAKAEKLAAEGADTTSFSGALRRGQ